MWSRDRVAYDASHAASQQGASRTENLQPPQRQPTVIAPSRLEEPSQLPGPSIDSIDGKGFGDWGVSHSNSLRRATHLPQVASEPLPEATESDAMLEQLTALTDRVSDLAVAMRCDNTDRTLLLKDVTP